MAASRKNIDPAEDARAQAQAAETDEILRKLNRGMSMYQICRLYGMSGGSLRNRVARVVLYMNLTEYNYLMDASDYLGMSMGDATTYFAREGLAATINKTPAAQRSTYDEARRRQARQTAYDYATGLRGNLGVYPPPATPKKKVPKKKKASTKKVVKK